jgi:hypothetical protein
MCMVLVIMLAACEPGGGTNLQLSGRKARMLLSFVGRSPQ